MLRFAVCALLLVGCTNDSTRGPTSLPDADPTCTVDLTSAPSLGSSGKVGYTYFPAVAQSLSVPLASRAHTFVIAFATLDTRFAGDVRSSAPEIARLALVGASESSCEHQYLISVSAGTPGQSELILVDEDGGEIDRTTLAVEATVRLAVDRGWDDPGGPEVLAGSLQGVHVTTIGASGVTVGTGAVSFALDGTLAPYPDPDAQPPWWGGDAITFAGIAGQGRVVADCDQAHVEIPVEVLDPPAITDWQLRALAPAKFPDPVEVQVSASAGTTPVFGAECDWSWPFPEHPPLWSQGGWIGASPTATYRFTAGAPGRYTAVCTLPGGASESVDLEFD